MRPEIDLIPMDDIDEKVVSDLKTLLKERGCIVRMYARGHSPKTSVNLYRKQNNVEIIVDTLGGLSGKVIAVTDKDLYSGKLNYVFHFVEENGPAVISIHRMRPEFYQEKPSNAILMERLMKETLFCIGRMHGLKLCPNPRCIMHKAASARDIDMKLAEFCKDCKISNAIETRL